MESQRGSHDSKVSQQWRYQNQTRSACLQGLCPHCGFQSKQCMSRHLCVNGTGAIKPNNSLLRAAQGNSYPLSKHTIWARVPLCQLACSRNSQYIHWSPTKNSVWGSSFLRSLPRGLANNKPKGPFYEVVSRMGLSLDISQEMTF